MPTRHPLPTLWLFTDPRGGDPAVAATRLPKGSGIVFRHRELPTRDRRRLFEQVRGVARRRRQLLLLAGPPALARAWGADGAHGWVAGRVGFRSCAVHSRTEGIAAQRRGADLVFASPVFPTRSHPAARPLGPVRLGLMLRGLRVPVVALGGMDRGRARRLRGLDLAGWAAIDAFRT